MEIEKIFSEIDTDEKLYSVLMTEEEYRLFNEKIKNKEKESVNSWGLKGKKQKLAVGIPFFTGLTVGGNMIGKALDNSIDNKENIVKSVKKVVKANPKLSIAVPASLATSVAIHKHYYEKNTGKSYWSGKPLNNKLINNKNSKKKD